MRTCHSHIAAYVLHVTDTIAVQRSTYCTTVDLKCVMLSSCVMRAVLHTAWIGT